MEHHSNIVPWQMLCEEKGANLRVVPINDAGELLMDEYENMLSSKTKLVSITHVSNALGTILPATQIARMAHAHGAAVLFDGAQAVPHMPVDVQELDCDFYVFSGHKLFGPTGIGILYGKAEFLEAMPPFLGGGEMIKFTMQAAQEGMGEAEMTAKAEAMVKAMQVPLMLVGAFISLVMLYIGDKTIPKGVSED